MVIMMMSISEVKICYWPGRFWLELILSKSYLMSWILQVRINQKIIDFNLFVKTWNYSRFSCFCNQILSSIPFTFEILKKSAKKSSLPQEQFCTKKQPDQTLHNCRALLSTNCRIFLWFDRWILWNIRSYISVGQVEWLFPPRCVFLLSDLFELLLLSQIGPHLSEAKPNDKRWARR